MEPVVVDCVGLMCPVPIYLTARRMQKLPVGALVRVLADDPVIMQDMPAWCRQTGHTIMEHTEDQGCHVYVVRKEASKKNRTGQK